MPSIVSSAKFAESNFQSTIDVTIDFGSGSDRWVLVCVTAPSSSAGTYGTGYVSGCVLDPAGVNVSMTLEADNDLSTYAGLSGRLTWFRLNGSSLPTGSKVIRATAVDSNTKLRIFAVTGDGASALAASPNGTYGQSTGTSLTTGAVASASGALVVALGQISSGANALTVTGTSGTTASTLLIDSAAGDVWYVLSEAGASSVTMDATISGHQFTPGWFGRAWSVAGAGGTTVRRMSMMGIG